MRRLLPLAGLIALCSFAPPAASAATAPARVAYPLGPPASSGTNGAYPPSPSLALPGGGVLTFVIDGTTGRTRALQLRRDGSLDPAFGAGGMVALPEPANTNSLTIGQAEPLSGGRLLIAGTLREASTFSAPRLVVMRLLPSGAPDPSFGTGGVVVTTSLSGPVGTAPIAVGSDGSITLTGSRLRPGEPNPINPATTDWVVARLNADGSPDTSFGVVTVPVGLGLRTEGASIVLTPGGSMVATGRVSAASGGFRQAQVLVGLTASGALDPTFNAGAPALVALGDVRQLTRRADGDLELAGSQGVARFTAAGIPDAAFATNGVLTFGSGGADAYVPTPDGGGLLQRTAGTAPAADVDRRITVQRVTAAGALAGQTTLFTPFGGGLARPDNRKEIPVKQNAFFGRLVRRDDGSFLLVGGLSVYVPTGKMDDFSASFFAAQAFTPGLQPDRSFGGPQQRTRLTVQIRRQRAQTAAAKGRILVKVTASQAGLVFLRIRDARNRILASGTQPIYAPGSRITSVLMTSRSRSQLSRARKGLRISVRHDYRDIFAATANGVTKGRLG